MEGRSKDRDFQHNVKKSVLGFLGNYAHVLASSRDQESFYFISIKENRVLKSIVLRLENAASICSTEIRSLAVVSLAKVAFRSSFETRLHIFQFLVNLDESITSKIVILFLFIFLFYFYLFLFYFYFCLFLFFIFIFYF